MKVIVIIASFALLGLVLEPLVRSPFDDGYPLSTYPMFASRRPTKLTVDYAYGVDRAGARTPIWPALVGSHEVLQAKTILDDAVHHGRAATAKLCGEIAERVAGVPRLADLVEVRIVSGTHDAVDYLVYDKTGREVVRATCPVVRP